jgi:EpsD family peptidyl-prolyl cis-trans isomerase
MTFTLRICATFLLAVVLSSRAMAQADKPPAQPEKPVAVVNGVPIKQSTLQFALQGAISQGNQDSPQLREALTKQLIARELFVQEAAKQGLDKDPDVLAIAEEAKRNAMIQRYLRGKVQPKAITDEDVKAHYDKVKATLGPKEYKMRVILVPNDQRAKDLREQLGKGKDFAELARQWSLAPSATRGGEVEWISFKTPVKEGETNGLPLPIAHVLEKLQKGAVSNPIEVQGKWWLVKLDDTRPTKVPSFDETKQSIRNMLSQQEAERATNELVNSLAKGAKISQ